MNGLENYTTNETVQVPKVYKAISDVSSELARDGISKMRNNQQQGYRFRGIDDVYNAIASLLPKHGLVIIPKTISREVAERQTKNGATLFYVTVECDFDFVSVEDGSIHTAKTYGEAMDSGDKATNKAMSAAYKYAAIQVFCIPTEGDNDTENTSHDVAKEASPWTDDLKVSARKAADTGIESYQAWWNDRPESFRTKAVKTAEHTEYKRIASKQRAA